MIIIDIENLEILEIFKKFISSISKNDNIAILHDSDADGLTAGVLAKKSLQRCNLNVVLKSPKHHSSGGREITDKYVKLLDDNNVTHLLVLDLPVEDWQGIEKLNNIEVLVMDHHPITAKTISNDIKIIKPGLYQTKLDSTRICTANIVYTFFSKIIEISDLAWIAASGMIGDITYDYNKKFVDKILTKYDMEIKSSVFETELGTIAEYLAYSDSIGTVESLEKACNALENAKSPHVAIENLKVFSYVADDVKRILDQFDLNKEIINNVVFYNIQPKYKLNSIISTILSVKYVQDNILIITEKKGDITTISARCHNCKYNMGKMLHDVTEKLINAGGGGHIPAAGARIQTIDYEKFKILIFEWLKGE